jgi:hypothetical protein
MRLINIQERFPTIVRDASKGSLPHVDNTREEKTEDANGVELPHYEELFPNQQ